MFDSEDMQRDFGLMNVGSNKQKVKGLLIFSVISLPLSISPLFVLCSGSMRRL